MPAPWKTREKRIKELVKWAENHNIKSIEELIDEAFSRWPTVRKATLKSYAEATLLILRQQQKKRAEEERKKEVEW